MYYLSFVTVLLKGELTLCKVVSSYLIIFLLLQILTNTCCNEMQSEHTSVLTFFFFSTAITIPNVITIYACIFYSSIFFRRVINVENPCNGSKLEICIAVCTVLYCTVICPQVMIAKVMNDEAV